MNTSPTIIKIVRATKPNAREKRAKTNFSKKERCEPEVSLSIFHGEKSVRKKSGIENALKAYITRFFHDSIPECTPLF